MALTRIRMHQGRGLLEAYKQYHVDYKYFECPHSGHGLQNDKIYKEYMEMVEEYLNQYMPVSMRKKAAVPVPGF